MRLCSVSGDLELLSAILQWTSCPPVLFPVSSLASPLTHLGGSSTTPPRVMFYPLKTSRLTSRCLTTISFPTALPLSPPPPLFLVPATPPVDPLSPQGPAPSHVSQVDPAEPVKVAVDSGAARGAEPAGAGTGGAEPERVESWGAEPAGAEPGGAEPGGAASWGAEPPGVPLQREPLSSQRLREWYARRCCRATSAAGAGAAGGAAGAGGAGGAAGAGAAGAAGPGGARSGGTGAAGAGGAAGVGAAGPSSSGAGAAGGAVATGGAGGAASAGAAGGAVGDGVAGAAGPGGARTGCTGAAGVVTRDPGAEGTGAFSGGNARPRPYYVPLLQQVLGPTPPLLSPPPVRSQSQFQSTSPQPGPSPYSGPIRGLTKRREPASRPASPKARCESLVRTVRAGHHVSRPRPPSVTGTHSMTLRLSTAPQRVPLPSPLASSLPAGPDPESNSLRAASPTVSRFLAIAVTDPLFESTATSALVAELVDFAAACRLDFATSLVAESASASVFPPSVKAMDAKMASWKSPGTYVDEVPPPGANIGVDFFQTFSPTPKITTLRVLLHVAAQCDYELHSLDFSTAFLQGSLHEEIWLRRPPGFTGSFPAGTQWSLWRPVYGLRQAPREWHDTLRTTLAALGFAPSTADSSLFLCTDTTLPPFYVLVYVDNLVFATAHTEVLAHMNSELQKRHTCTDLVHRAWGSCLEDGLELSSVVTLTPPGSSCEGEIYAGAMAAQELRWLTYLLTDLGEAPRSPPVLYVNNKAMLALCQEHRLEHRTKHMALRYFLARELQQHGQLCLAFVASQANTADVFTKALQPCDHQRFCIVLGPVEFTVWFVFLYITLHVNWPCGHLLVLRLRVVSEPLGAVLTMAGPEDKGGKGAGGSGEAQAQGQPHDSAMVPMQPSLGQPRDEPKVFGLDNPWVRKSAQAYLLLGQALGSSQIRHIKPFQREPEKGPKAWASLKGVHAPATAAVAVVLERQMAALRIEEDEAVKEGVQKLFDLLTRLEGADLNYSELQKKTKLLALLPESWSSLIINLNRDLPRLSLEDVKRAILQEDFRRRELASADGAEAASIGRGYGRGRGRGRGGGRFGSNNFNGGRGSGGYGSDNKSYGRGRGRFDGECHYCPKSGHMWRGCHKIPDGWTPAQGQEGRGAGGGRGRGRGGRGGRGGGAASMKSAVNGSESRDDCFPGQFFFVSTQAPAGPEKDEGFEEPAAVGKVALHSLDYWVIDSGATYSMTPRADLLTELEPSPVKNVTSALGQRAEVKGMGKPMFKGTDGKMVGLKNVICVPNLAANLIPVRRVQKAGMDTSSKGAKTYTARLGERILWDLHEDRDVYNEMWQIPVVPMPKERQVAASISTKGEAVGIGDSAIGRTKEIKSKKCNLGGTSKLSEHKESVAAAKKPHKDEENPKIAAEEEYGENMWGTIASAAFSNPTSATGECDWLTLHRRMGHFTRYPFSSSEATANAPLDEVVMDVVGPLKLGSAGAAYFLTIVDVYTRMTWVYVLSKKSDVAETVKTDWLPMVEWQQDRLVKAIRTDQGGEFLSKEFSLWLKKNGIRHSLTMPYSPAMNGIAERANRTITETACGLLIEAALPDYFWPDAVRSACVAKNRALNHVGADKWVPYMEWIGRKPKVDWQAAMDSEMASWKSTGTYVDAVPLSRVNIVNGMWIFRVKRPPGSPPAFKARYVARGFNFLQGSLHEEIWLRGPPGFTGSFPAGTQWSLRRLVYGLYKVPREWHDTLRTTLAALGFTPSIADPSLFLHTDTSLLPFYILVYVDDLVFATADTEALTLVLQRFGFQFSSPQPTPLSTGHSLSAPPSDESVEPSGPYPELVGCLIYLMTCTRPDLAYPLSLLACYVAPGRHRMVHWDAAKRVLCYLWSTSGMGLVLGGRAPVVLTGHANSSWVDDSATQRSSQGYTFSLGSGSVSWRSTRLSSVLSSSCEAEIYAGAMAAQELCWLTFLLIDLGEQLRSPLVLYVDNKAMIALCQEHRTKRIALRYFLARELQQRGQLRLACVATRANTADIFTEALPPGDHQRFSTV
ncbi:unnamed protein product [Closterium sp. NIES-54]